MVRFPQQYILKPLGKRDIANRQIDPILGRWGSAGVVPPGGAVRVDDDTSTCFVVVVDIVEATDGIVDRRSCSKGLVTWPLKSISGWIKKLTIPSWIGLVRTNGSVPHE